MNRKVVLGTGVVVVAAVAIGLYASANKGDGQLVKLRLH